MSAFGNVDFSLVERRLVASLIAVVIGYLRERSKVSSQHKLATFDELAGTTVIGLWFSVNCVPNADPKLKNEYLRLVVNRLIADGKLLEYGPYLSTEPKEIS